MWEPSDWIAALAVITGPLGALSVAFYTARQHVRHHAQAQKEERRVAVRLLRAEIEAADARVQSMLDWERWRYISSLAGPVRGANTGLL